MHDIKLKMLSPLEKVMKNSNIEFDEFCRFSMLDNEKKSFQLYISCDCEEVFIDIKSDLNCINAFTVEYIHSDFSINEKTADDYVIKSEDGYYPDLLLPIENNKIKLENGCKTLWFEIDSSTKLIAGEHKIEITVSNEENSASKSITADVINYSLEKQSLIFTNWFHTDCLMEEYGFEAFSDEYWKAVENYMKTAVRHGMDCVLTPIFTPPLDIAKRGERPTVQLIDVNVVNGRYSFNFDKLKKWISLCQSCGIEYFEFSHLFTQWGAGYATKIMATTDGKYKRLFGWNTSVFSKKYKQFLNQLSIELKALIEELELKDKTLIHISDEPALVHLLTYRKASKITRKCFDGYKIVDALSNYTFYKTGLVTTPIVATNHIEPFINNVPELWAYYCSAQDNNFVSNRLFSMPSERNRVLGFQLYKFDAKGFLHWGYNFWNTRYSKKKINPYEISDAGGAFQSGDSFVVYPKKDMTALCSLRLKVFYDAFQDMMALQTLEKLAGRKKAVEVLEKGLEKEITFSEYPHSSKWLLETRERINEEIRILL